MFTYSQPAMLGEVAVMLWLVIKGAKGASVGGSRQMSIWILRLPERGIPSVTLPQRDPLCFSAAFLSKGPVNSEEHSWIEVLK